MTNQYLKLGSLLLMLVVSYQSQAVEINKEIKNGVNWIVLGESPLLDRSSKYLHKGQTERGLRYARKALRRKLSAQAKQIAHHNLCLGYVSLGEIDKASQHCDFAQSNMSGGYYLTQVSEGLYRVTSFRSSSVDLPALDTIVARNLEIHGVSAENSRVVKLVLEK